MQENEQLNPEELQSPSLATLPTLPETEETLNKNELEAEELTMEGVEDILDTTEDDLDVKTYYKVSPTFYIKSVETEEVDEEGEPLEMFKVLNPEEGLVEERELTDDEKKELFVQQLKMSRKVFNPLSHPSKVVGKTSIDHPFLTKKDGTPVQRFLKDRERQTNVTNNKFGSAYKQKRKNRNKQAKVSRKANR